MAVVDIGSTAATVALVLVDTVVVMLRHSPFFRTRQKCIKVGVWLQGNGLLLHLSSCLLLPASTVRGGPVVMVASSMTTPTVLLMLLHWMLELHTVCYLQLLACLVKLLMHH